MKVGLHAGEAIEAIVERKLAEERMAGTTLWGYGGGSCNPFSQVQPFARGAPEPVAVLMIPTTSPYWGSTSTAFEMSTDGHRWQPLPDGVRVTGSKFALVLRGLHRVAESVDLGQYEVAIGPNRGRAVESYLRGRVDKVCARRAEVPTPSGHVAVALRATLVEPFAVALRSGHDRVEPAPVPAIRLSRDTAFAARAAVQVAAAAIPIIGGPVATALAIWEGERVSRRLQSFMADIADVAQRVDRTKIDHAFVETEAFQDLVLAAVDAGRRTSNPSKRAMVASILVGGATSARPPDLDLEALLDTVAALSPTDLEIAREIYRAVDRTTFGIIQGAQLPAVPDGEFHVARLIAAGLIRGARPFNDFAPQQLRYLPTDTFDRLMRLLEATGT